jgi:hypothetical protein
MKTYPPEIKEIILLSIKNIKYLLNDFMQSVPEKNKEILIEAFQKKLKSSIKLCINWYEVYQNSIPDGLLMILDQKIKLVDLEQTLTTPLSKLNYNINIEIYNYMQTIYNLYPNR